MELNKTVTTDDGYVYNVKLALDNSHTVLIEAEDNQKYKYCGSYMIDIHDKYTYIKLIKEFVCDMHSSRMKMPHYDKEPYELLDKWDGNI